MEHQPSHRSAARQVAGLKPDLIVACASAPGRGGVAIVRLSGAALDLETLARGMLSGGRVGTVPVALPEARRATRAHFLDASGATIDEGLVLHFPAPYSYTGESVLELHTHGSPVITEALVARALQLGARRAEPGEFTRRAYLNEKLDLAQAEAVASLIDASSVAAARAAVRSLQGEFSAAVHALTHGLTELRAYVEAAIDFPEEEVDFLADAELHTRLSKLRRDFDVLTKQSGQGRLLTEGFAVVIAGAPNAGKSTLLNQLAGHDAAIVSDIPGTTRDVLRERILIDGLPIQLLDTAGLRETTDTIEAEGVRRARMEMTRADRVLLIIDASDRERDSSERAARAQLPDDVPISVVMNKIDLANPAITNGTQVDIYVSAKTGEGIDRLREHLKRCAGWQGEESGTLAARARHLDALQCARQHLEAGATQLTEHRAGELVAEELRAAQRALGEITGEVTSDALLGEIFGRFCIGK